MCVCGVVMQCVLCMDGCINLVVFTYVCMDKLGRLEWLMNDMIFYSV